MPEGTINASTLEGARVGRVPYRQFATGRQTGYREFGEPPSKTLNEDEQLLLQKMGLLRTS
jgi:hypothetical protein